MSGRLILPIVLLQYGIASLLIVLTLQTINVGRWYLFCCISIISDLLASNLLNSSEIDYKFASLYQMNAITQSLTVFFWSWAVWRNGTGLVYSCTSYTGIVQHFLYPGHTVLTCFNCWWSRILKNHQKSWIQTVRCLAFHSQAYDSWVHLGNVLFLWEETSCFIKNLDVTSRWTKSRIIRSKHPQKPSEIMDSNR